MSQLLIVRGEQSGFADANRDDGKRYVVRANEKLTAFRRLKQRFAVVRIVFTGILLQRTHA